MKKIIIDFEISGCLNNCYHCHCNGGIKERKFMNQDKVMDIASKFRDKLDVEVSVRLVQEQTYYPDFFDLVTKLEDNGFLKKGNEKLLVTNC
ncbi:hypothetical protein [Dethiothermospora halolimnae]|uniref:hypothetical protein n=1 Tax=Dethiothermospora halolimnae TaxID=3114390 RepID=UPI003CCB8965